jgi:hypothetical protein
MFFPFFIHPSTRGKLPCFVVLVQDRRVGAYVDLTASYVLPTDKFQQFLSFPA